LLSQFSRYQVCVFCLILSLPIINYLSLSPSCSLSFLWPWSCPVCCFQSLMSMQMILLLLCNVATNSIIEFLK
jgi:hypothetical protein